MLIDIFYRNQVKFINKFKEKLYNFMMFNNRIQEQVKYFHLFKITLCISQILKVFSINSKYIPTSIIIFSVLDGFYIIII